jgi:cellulose synthase/poly-beta-1,6-N-acetylglucosamine synthase-like glycosyltransferase
MTFEPVFIVLFFAAAVAIAYTYAGYPVLVYLVARVFPRPVKQEAFEPFVTVLITAFNEERSIAAKIENTLLLDYPEEKLEVLIASDGSTDRTDEIVREFEKNGVKLFRQEGRKGKTHTQNGAVGHAKGEFILFSDATTEYQPDVLKKLMPLFADETVGCATGKLVYFDPTDSDVGKGARSYWNYETFLKQSESAACSLIGASGCLYVVRKSAYKPMYAEACSDFLICTVLYEQGLRSIFVPDAVCYEETNNRSSNELKMRVRVISQTFTDLWRNKSMLNPLKSGFYALQLISHKLLRYMVPLFLTVALISSLILAFSSNVFGIIALLQILFYVTGFAVWQMERAGLKSGPLSVILYFLIANYASAAGFYKFLSGERFASWEPIRDDAETGDEV